MRGVDDEHIGPFDELLENLLGAGGFQIERDAALVAIGQVPGIGILRRRLRRNLVPYPPEVAGRRLDFDDVSAEVGQDHSGAWASDETREVHDLQAGEDIVVWHGFPSFSVRMLTRSVSAAVKLRGAFFEESR